MNPTSPYRRWCRFVLPVLMVLLTLLAAPAYGQTRKKTTTKQKTTKVDQKTKLRNEKAAAEKARKLQQQKAAQLNKSIRQNLDSVLILDNQIGRQKKGIDSLSHEISTVAYQIDTLETRINRLKREIETRKRHYAKALQRMQRTRSVQQRMVFFFSADNFAQIIRRMRYLREYSVFQKAQAQMLKDKQEELKTKQDALNEAKSRLEASRASMEQRQRSLQTMKTNCESKVTFLNKNLATVQKQIQEYQKKEKSLDAQIERIIQAEIEAARRAEAERKRKAEEARRRAEAEAREKARRLAEAKAAQERARRAQAEAEATRRAARTEAEKTAAKAAVERAKADVKEAERNVSQAAKEEKAERSRAEAWKNNDNTSKLSGSFTANKGRLPMPVTGSYAIVGHYGKYTVPGLRNVTLDNKGIDIKGQPGCSARAVFDGEVSSVFQFESGYVVMLRHGSYISVYSGLSSVSVSRGQKVKARDTLGTVARNGDGNYVLQFQLRNESTRLNPEQWVR